MADGGGFELGDVVDPPIAPNIICPLVTVSDLPSPTAAGKTQHVEFLHCSTT